MHSSSEPTADALFSRWLVARKKMSKNDFFVFFSCYNSLRLDEGQSTTHQRRTYHYSCYKSTTTPLLQHVNTSAKTNKDRKCVNMQSKAKMTYDN